MRKIFLLNSKNVAVTEKCTYKEYKSQKINQ